MRVVEISPNRTPTPHPKSGAVEKYVFNISRILVNLGFEVHLISIDEKRTLTKIDGILRHSYPKKQLHPVDSILNKVLCKISPHAQNINVISTTCSIYSILLSIKETFGLPHIIHNHSLTTAVPPLLFRTLSRNSMIIMHHHNIPKRNIINKTILKYYNLHFAVSNYVRKEVIRRFNISPDKIHVVYNGIDVNRFSCPSDDDRRRIRDFYGIREDEIALLYIGRITPEKGLHHLIEAFRIVCGKLHQCKVKLLIVGPIGYFHQMTARDLVFYNYIEKLLHRYNLHENVKYLGFLSDDNIKSIYAASDIVVVPSIWHDPCPSTVLEALASCKPVVAYPVGGIPEILRPLNYGFLAKRVSPRELSEVIIKVISNYDKIDLKSLREYVQKRFSVESLAYKLKTLFETMF